MLLSDHKKGNTFKAKTLIERWVLGTSNRCPDHLSRQFLTTAPTFPYSSKNSSAEHIHALSTCLTLISTLTDSNSLTHTLTHTYTHIHTHTSTHTYSHIHTLTHTHTHTYTHSHIHTLTRTHIHTYIHSRTQGHV